MISVALPAWNSRKIAWLCMESLCRQQKPNDEWELIIFEEKHSGQLGEKYFRSYENRLSCSRLVYLTSDEKIPLPQKWVTIANETSEESIAYLMCAADNYYHQFMLRDTEAAIREADWCIMTKGYFYDFSLDEVCEYNYTGLVGLHMAAKTDMVKQFEKSSIERGIDGWFSKQMMSVAHDRGLLLKCFIDGSDHWQGTVCTNGYNNISLGRGNLLRTYKAPFYQTETKLKDIVPKDVYLRMKKLCLEFQ